MTQSVLTKESASPFLRLAPLAGIAFAVLFVVGFLAGGDTPEYDQTAEWIAFYEDSGNRTAQVAGAYMMVLSALAFLWFAWALTARLTGFRWSASLIGTLSGTAAIIFAITVMAGALLMASISASMTFTSDVPVPDDPNLGIQFEQLGLGMILLPGAMAVGIFIGLTSELARRTTTLPMWLIWAGYFVAVAQLAAPFFIPFLFVPVWALVASVVVLVRPAPLPQPPDGTAAV